MSHQDRSEGLATISHQGERLNDIVSIGRGDISLRIDGQSVRACSGETLLTVLSALDQRDICRTDRGQVMGAWCGMGICYSCLVMTNGRKMRACQVRVEEGMDVRTRTSLFELQEELEQDLGGRTGASALP